MPTLLIHFFLTSNFSKYFPQPADSITNNNYSCILLPQKQKSAKVANFSWYSDTIKTPLEVNGFKNDTLTVRSMQAAAPIASKGLGKQGGLNWELPIIILLFIIVAMIKFFYKTHISKLFTALFNPLVAEMQQRENRSNIAKILLNLSYYLATGLFLTYLYPLTIGRPQQNSFLFFLLISSLVALFHAGHYSLNFALGFVFNKKKLAKQYNTIISTFNQALAIILLPIVTFSLYGPELFRNYVLWSGLILGLIWLAIRILQMSKVFFKEDVTILHQILYLCTLEIMPFLLTLKFLKVLIIN